MPKSQSNGRCYLCGGGFSRTAMTRHLQRCGQSKSAAATRATSSHPCAASFHLFVEGRYAKAYWLHLAVPLKAHLDTLDTYLRNIWLECCGHLSAFEIGGERYASQPMSELSERGMRVAVDRVLEVGVRFHYEYDYGSTTALALKVVGLLDKGPAKRIQLLARNDAPEVACDQCAAARIAAKICTECIWSGSGWLCEECASQHECGEEMLLPVVNSPRVGVCAYTG